MTAALEKIREPEGAVRQTHPLKLEPSPNFAQWLAELNTSLCLTTYQAGKIFLIGSADGERLSLFERTLNRCMGLAVTPRSIYVSTQWQLWRLENALSQGQTKDGYDRAATIACAHEFIMELPQGATVTGDIDIHDMAVDVDERLVFVNTLFSCLATTSETHSFRPLWKPSFITNLAPEDRCHLNGLAMRDGIPAYVTAVSQTDSVGGWREHRRRGGCVIDVKSNDVVGHGLSMPHSPRWHDDKLWLHNSGSGEFGFIDFATGRFEPVCCCPGYLRGLTFCGGYAVMGLSRPRGAAAFAGLVLDDTLKKAGIDAQCGLLVVDLTTGETVHSLKIEGVVEELYDVAALPGVSRPMAIGLQSDDIARVISIEE